MTGSVIRLWGRRGDEPCRHPGHNPPMHLYIRPGTSYTHKCPGCGETTQLHGGPTHLGAA